MLPYTWIEVELHVVQYLPVTIYTARQDPARGPPLFIVGRRPEEPVVLVKDETQRDVWGRLPCTGATF